MAFMECGRVRMTMISRFQEHVRERLEGGSARTKDGADHDIVTASHVNPPTVQKLPLHASPCSCTHPHAFPCGLFGLIIPHLIGQISSSERGNRFQIASDAVSLALVGIMASWYYLICGIVAPAIRAQLSSLPTHLFNPEPAMAAI